jgi:hypothetical protein
MKTYANTQLRIGPWRNRLTKRPGLPEMPTRGGPAHLGPGFQPSKRTTQTTTRRAPRGTYGHYIITSRTLSPNPTRRRRLLLLQAAPPLPISRASSRDSALPFDHGEQNLLRNPIRFFFIFVMLSFVVVAGGRGSGSGGGGRGAAEEEDVPQVQLPRRGPRRAPRHVHGRPRPALPRARTPEVTTSLRRCLLPFRAWSDDLI